MKNIRVIADFMPEDMRAPEGESEGEEIEEVEGDAEEEVAEAEEATWEQAMGAVTGKEVVPAKIGEESESESENEGRINKAKSLGTEPTEPVKKTRMTTNKKKTSNYYSTANVKNKNKDKTGMVKKRERGEKKTKK